MSDITIPDHSDLPTPPEPPPVEPPRRRVPADYYNSSPDEVRPVLPRGARIGCGWASAAFLVLAFIGGAIVVNYGIGPLMEMLLGQMQTEIEAMYAADVSQTSRDAIDAELTRLRDGISTEKIPVSRLDPIMKQLREAIADSKVTSDEVEPLLKVIRDANSSPRPRVK